MLKPVQSVAKDGTGWYGVYTPSGFAPPASLKIIDSVSRCGLS